MTTYENYITDAGRVELQAVVNLIATMKSQVNSSTVTPEFAASVMEGIYYQLLQARALQLNSLSNANKTIFNALLSQLQTCHNLYQTYLSDPTGSNQTALSSYITGTLSEANFSTVVNALNKTWSIQDRVFYEYSKAGEAELNDQLGQLGDALDSLAQVIDVVNQLETVLSINPVNAANTSQVSYDGTLVSDYYQQAPNSLMLTDPNGGATQLNAAVYTYNAYQNLVVLQGNFTAGSSIYNSIATVLADLQSAGVNGWSGVTNPPTATTSAFWGSSFKAFWQNTNWRQDINNLQTSLSSQNDVQKQNLRQAMFIYQEFIKSAALVMDRVYDAVKEIASRISR